MIREFKQWLSEDPGTRVPLVIILFGMFIFGLACVYVMITGGI
jgi:hypothetical protein